MRFQNNKQLSLAIKKKPNNVQENETKTTNTKKKKKQKTEQKIFNNKNICEND